MHRRAPDAAMGLRGAVRGRAFKVTTEADEPPLVHRTWSSASSRPPGPISSGSRTSPTSRPGPASSTWPSSSTSSLAPSSAGASRTRCGATWPSTRSSRRFTLDPARRLVHHSDRGTQYPSIRYTERLAEAGVERSVGSVGDSYDNALAETINGLYKTEVIRRRGPWRNIDAGRVRHARVGRLVQQPPAARAHRLRAAGRVRGGVLSKSADPSQGGLTQVTEPPRSRGDSPVE